MASRKEAYADYKAGLTPTKIAQKYGVSINTAKSWIARSKKDEASRSQDAPARPARARPAGQKACPSAAGASPPNAGTAIDRGRGAPMGNSNAQRHGAFSRRYFRELSPEDQEMIDSLPMDEEAILQMQLKDLTLKASYLKRQIEMLEQQQQTASGLAISTMSRDHGQDGDSSSTTFRPVLDSILRLHDELGRTHGRITNVVRTLTQYREGQARLWMERERLRIMEQKVTGFIALDVEAEEVQDADVIEVDDEPAGK